MLKRTIRIASLTGVLLAMAMAPAAFAQETADRIFSGGHVLTMDDALPVTEAVAVKDGRILAVGKAADVMRHRGTTARSIDPQNRDWHQARFDRNHESKGHSQLWRRSIDG